MLVLGVLLAGCGVASPPPDCELAAQPDCAGYVAARPDGTEEDEAAARSLFVEARAAFERGDFEVALASFRQAHGRWPLPRLHWNVVMTLERLGRTAELYDAVHALYATLDRCDSLRERVVRFAARHGWWIGPRRRDETGFCAR